VDHVIVSDSAERLTIVRSAQRDLCDAGQLKRFETAFSESLGINARSPRKRGLRDEFASPDRAVTRRAFAKLIYTLLPR